MKTRSFLGKVVHVFFSNVLTILSGVLIGFLIPKVMDISGYAYYKTYTLYINYVALFTLGITEGIYLKFAGKKLEEIDIQSTRTVILLFILAEAVISALGITIALSLNGQYSMVFVFVFLYLFIVNCTVMFESLAQALDRFHEYSFLSGLRSALNIGTTLLLFFCFRREANLNYLWLLATIECVNGILLICYVIRYRSFLFGTLCSLSKAGALIWDLLKLGLPLLLCTFVGNALINVDRQIVSIFYPEETYAHYAFAYNLVNLVTIAVGSVAIVLYPTLKKIDAGSQKNIVTQLLSSVTFVACLAPLAFYPLTAVVLWFLPNYAPSLSYVSMVFPSLIFTAIINVVYKNYFKSFNMLKQFTIISLASLLLAVGVDLFGYFALCSIEFISYGTVFVSFVWFLSCTFLLQRVARFRFWKSLVATTCSVGVFYLLNATVSTLWIRFLIYLAFVVALFFVFLKDIRFFFTKKHIQ